MLVLQAHFSVLEGDGECGSLGDVTCAIWMLFTRLFQSAWFQKARTHAHTLAMLFVDGGCWVCSSSGCV